MLTPYDVMRLRRSLSMGSEEFIKTHSKVDLRPDIGFPTLHLAMLDNENKSCPFVRDAGCSVYPDRPGACRTYPIGRAARMGENGEVVEQFFLVEEEHCQGFSEDKEWDVSEWGLDQGVREYNDWNDRYMVLLAGQKARGGQISSNQANMALLALYQLDRFRQFITDMKALSKFDIPEQRVEAIMSDEEGLLDFAYDWMELILFGSCAGLKPKG